ncbi:MAG: thioredoxin family protein [Candidatus Babeliales bacterium]
MKRSYHLLVTLVTLSYSLSAVAGCPCAREKRAMRAKRTAVQPMAPVTSVSQSVGNIVSDLTQGNVVGATGQAIRTAPDATASVVQPSMPKTEKRLMEVEAAPMPKKMKTEAPAPAPQVMENNRIDLSKQSDFDALITKHPHVIAVFTTTWCGPCKNLKPVLDEIRTSNKDVMFVYVDGDEYPGLVSKYASVGFPTLKLFKNGKEVAQAIGGQSKDEIQSLINQHFKGGVPTFVMGDATESIEQVAAPAPQPIKMPAPAPAPMQESMTANKIVLVKDSDFDGHLRKNKNVIGIFTTTWCGPCKTLKPVLEELVGSNANVTFVYVDGDRFPSLVKKYASIGFPTLKFFKNGKEVAQTVGGRSRDELQSMINQHYRG